MGHPRAAVDRDAIRERAAVRTAVEVRWPGQTCVVAATGPSLTQEVADRCKGLPVVAVSDAYRLMPWAPVMHSADTDWWKVHNGCPDFAGEKWTLRKEYNDQAVIEKYGLKAIHERHSNGFSLNQHWVMSGENSGLQAINLAILMGAARVVLVGFDMRIVEGRRHFFGDHPAPLRNNDYRKLLGYFRNAAANMPDGIEVINCTPGSAIAHFPFMSLEDALAGKPVPIPEPPKVIDRMKIVYTGLHCGTGISDGNERDHIVIFGHTFPKGAAVEVTDQRAISKLPGHPYFRAVPDEPATVVLPAEAPEIGAAQKEPENALLAAEPKPRKRGKRSE